MLLAYLCFWHYIQFSVWAGICKSKALTSTTEGLLNRGHDESAKNTYIFENAFDSIFQH